MVWNVKTPMVGVNKYINRKHPVFLLTSSYKVCWLYVPDERNHSFVRPDWDTETGTAGTGGNAGRRPPSCRMWLPRVHVLIKCNDHHQLSLFITTLANRLGCQWCGIFHYHKWTASINPMLLFYHADSCSMRAFPFSQIKSTNFAVIICFSYTVTFNGHFLIFDLKKY